MAVGRCSERLRMTCLLHAPQRMKETLRVKGLPVAMEETIHGLTVFLLLAHSPSNRHEPPRRLHHLPTSHKACENPAAGEAKRRSPNRQRRRSVTLHWPFHSFAPCGASSASAWRRLFALSNFTPPITRSSAWPIGTSLGFDQLDVSRIAVDLAEGDSLAGATASTLLLGQPFKFFEGIGIVIIIAFVIRLVGDDLTLADLPKFPNGRALLAVLAEE